MSSKEAKEEAERLYPPTEIQRSAAAKGYDKGAWNAAWMIANRLGFEPSRQSTYEDMCDDIHKHVCWLEERAHVDGQRMQRGKPSESCE
jgi:hypothetical protein